MASNAMFHTLCLDATLQAAWRQVKGKNSAGGIDGVTWACFEDNVQKYITELADELKTGTWAPEPYLGIEIPKKKN